MADWAIAVVLVVLLLVGYVFGFLIGKKQKKPMALIVVDSVNPEINGGIYVIWDDDPHVMVQSGKLRNGQFVTMEVAVQDVYRRSQQNQGG